MKSQKITFIAATVFLILFGLAGWNYWDRAKNNIDIIIADDVTQLAHILNQIHKDCHIIDFEHSKNNIDFLNVISFEGSEVGPMNLKYPKKWHGAYLKDNPTMQEKYYQIIKTKQGYWVVPGDGVKLSNGLIIGKDIIIDEDTDMKKLVDTLLTYNQRPLAVQIMTNLELPQSSNTFQDKMTRDRLRGM